MPEEERKWIKSTSSIGQGACVELAMQDDEVLIRHSRRPTVVISYTRAEIAAFFEGVRRREFDHLLDD
jgi:hypothetical protein